MPERNKNDLYNTCTKMSYFSETQVYRSFVVTQQGPVEVTPQQNNAVLTPPYHNNEHQIKQAKNYNIFNNKHQQQRLQKSQSFRVPKSLENNINNINEFTPRASLYSQVQANNLQISNQSSGRRINLEQQIIVN